ncbi:MAG: DUF2505 domain-containing protein [Deltaproteobacteria bacterium]|nr:DUF2505 domain-containing protein [Deltaproteobacteria bacterium]
MKVSVRHTLDCSPETYWKKVFFDREYNQTLFLRDMKFPTWEVLEQKEGADRVERRVRVTPPQQAPELIKKLISGTISYEEVGTWTAADAVYRFDTITSVMTDKIKIAGTIRAEPSGPDQMVRRVEMDVSVNILLVGGKVEKFLAEQLQSNWDASAQFTNRWLADRKP